jgi:FKBP-type peptidyl-prolyl cis-trans isomerase FkpA
MLDGGLKVEDLTEGAGDLAEAGQTVAVHYTGWLADGRKFDSSRDRSDPFRFRLGAGRVIRGVRRLTIPPHLGYGAAGAGGVIPPQATLVFEVELLGID